MESMVIEQKNNEITDYFNANIDDSILRTQPDNYSLINFVA